MTGERPLLLVVVGTDHHPFDRLVQWVDGWLAAERTSRVRCVVQHGTSSAPCTAGAEGRPYLEHAELAQLMARAAMVVCHGGPSTIAEVRRLGQLPIVVPRSGSRGEHVDDHQQLFTARLAREGLILRADSEAELRSLLDRVVDTPATVQLLRTAPGTETPESAETPAAVRRFAELVDSLLSRGRFDRCRAPRVLYVGGFGRSGTTLLERILGQVPGVSAAGEVVHLWERGAGADERCGCGEAFSRCEFWTAVGKSAYGGWDQSDAQRVRELQRDVERIRRIPLLVVPWIAPRFRRRLRSLVRALDGLYTAQASVSGADVLVDSSKHASYAFVLRHAAVDLRVVHVVRDSRGVAFSWSKQVRRPEVVHDESYMATFSPIHASLYWSLNNVFFHALPRLGVPVLRVRYEDLLRDPVTTVERVVDFAGLAVQPSGLDHLEPDAVELHSDHTVAGNPMRFQNGRVALGLDEEWRALMPSGDRRVVSLLTWPLRARYGYLRSAGRAAP